MRLEGSPKKRVKRKHAWQSQGAISNLVSAIGEAMASNVAPAAFLDLFTSEFQKLFPVDRCDITVREEDGEHLMLLGEALSPGATVGSQLGCRQLVSDWGSLPRIYLEGQALISGDISRESSLCQRIERVYVAEGMHSYVAVPLRVQGKVIGSLSCSSRAVDLYTHEHLQLVRTAADRIAPFLEAYRKHQNEIQESKLGGAFAAIDRAIASSLDSDEIFLEFSRALSPFLEFDRISVVVLEGDGETVARLGAARRPGSSRRASSGHGVLKKKHIPTIARVIETGLPFIGYDHEFEDDLPASEVLVTRREGIRSSCVVPLEVGGPAFGTINFGSEKPHTYGPQHLPLLGRIASHVAPLIQNLRVYQRERHQRQVLAAQHEFIAALNTISSAMVSGFKPKRFMAGFCPQFLNLLPQTRRLEIGVYHPGRKCFTPLLECWTKLNTLQPSVSSERTEPLGIGAPVSDILLRGEGRLVADYRADAEWRKGYPILLTPLGESLRSGLHLPLIVSDRVIGHFICDSSDVSAYGDHQLELARQIASHLAPFVENCLLYRLEHELRERSEALAQITRTIAADASLREVFYSLEEQSQRLIPHDLLEVTLLGDAPGYATTYSTASGFQPVPSTTEIEPLTSSRSVSPGRKLRSGAWSPSSICVTLRVGGRITGQLSVSSQAENTDSESQVEVVEKLADLVALALERELLLNKVRAAAEGAAAMRGMEEGAEEERRRIAMDLHDQTFADLAACASRAENLAGDTGLFLDQARDQFAEQARGLRAILGDLRHLTEDLHPAGLDVFGLSAAIEAALGRAAARTRFNIQPVFVDRSENITEQMPPFHRQTIYRIVQEALNNAVAHSGAKMVEVSLVKDAGTLLVSIADDGRGFDPKQIRSGALGLHTMRHRAALIGASIDWRSRGPDSGCVVKLRVPIEVAAGGPKVSGDAVPCAESSPELHRMEQEE